MNREEACKAILEAKDKGEPDIFVTIGGCQFRVATKAHPNATHTVGSIVGPANEFSVQVGPKK